MLGAWRGGSGGEAVVWGHGDATRGHPSGPVRAYNSSAPTGDGEEEEPRRHQYVGWNGLGWVSWVEWGGVGGLGQIEGG